MIKSKKLQIFLILLLYFIISSVQQEQAYLINPLPRSSTVFTANTSQCYGSSVEWINIIAPITSSISLKWLIPQTLILNNTNISCAVQIFQSKYPLSFALIPVDISLDENNRFPCGLKENAKTDTDTYIEETRIFTFPQSIPCKTCVLQWSLYTNQGNFHQCSDILLEPNSTTNNLCEQTCSKGGFCKSGVCICYPGYSGESCDISTTANAETETDNTEILIYFFLFISVILLLLALFIGGYYWLEAKQRQRSERLLEIQRQYEERMRNSSNITYDFGSYSRRAFNNNAIDMQEIPARRILSEI